MQLKKHCTYGPAAKPNKIETGLRTNSAGIQYTLLLRLEAIGFPTSGLLLYAEAREQFDGAREYLSVQSSFKAGIYISLGNQTHKLLQQVAVSSGAL